MEQSFLISKYEEFQQKYKAREKIRISINSSFEAQLDTMQYVILSKFQKNAKNLFKEKKSKQCDKIFKRGFKELTDLEKVYYYILLVDHLEKIVNREFTPPLIQSGYLTCQAFSKTHSKIGWKEVTLKIDFDKRYLYVERENKLKAYDLNYYLLRKSKATQYNSLVLQAINTIVNQKGYQIHIGFKDVKLFRQWFAFIKEMISYIFWEKIKKMVYPLDIINSFQKQETKAEIEKPLKTQVLEMQIKQTDAALTKCESQKRFSKSIPLISQKKQQMHQSALIKSKSSLNQSKNKGSQSQSQSLQKSSHSIEIKTSSPRTSMKQNQTKILCEQNEDEGTFRSFGRLVGDDIQDIIDEQCVLRRILPEYQIENVSKLEHHHQQLYANKTNFLVYSNTQSSKNLKVFIEINASISALSCEEICRYFSLPQFYQTINAEVQENSIKTMLTSDNSIVIYQKNKPYNRLYRSRDFVFLRHQFRKRGRTYIVDKSVQDSNIPPFTTIVRGEMTNIYEIYEEKGTIKIIIDSFMQNFGYLKDLQQLNINLKYFKGFENLCQRLSGLHKQKYSAVLEMYWPKKYPQQSAHFSHQQIVSQSKALENELFGKIKVKASDDANEEKRQPSSPKIIEEKHQQKEETKKDLSQVQIYKKQQQKENKHDQYQNGKQSEAITDSDSKINSQQILQINQSLQKMEIEGEITFIEGDIKRVAQKIVRKYDSEGGVIIDYSYLHRRQQTGPQPKDKKEFVYEKQKNGKHPIWKGNWLFPQEGGLIFTNKKQIQDQKGVLKFILSQVAKNLVSGKSILNISLPVDIFSSRSNLQWFLYSMAYAPILVEPTLEMSQLDRFLNTVTFGMTISPLYLQMEKPFNPILGQTFQCYINGCPGYAQQISHHPPIAAFMLIGRGYRISAQVESKMKLNINSGTGINEGVYRINFQNGEQICYMSPSGQLVGLAYGDRKFNMIGKAYAWCEKTQMFLELIFNPHKTYFGKQQKPIDYVEGKVYKVKASFFKQFLKNKSGGPKKSDITEELGRFHGNWNKTLNFEDRTLLNYECDFPLQLQYQQFPLASDSNWREDITYRRLLQISSAQSWKQKLQIAQRKQRKLRQKYWSNKP